MSVHTSSEVQADRVCADFDRIALLPDTGFDHNRFYHPYLHSYVPVPCERALDIGCGTGAFARLLSLCANDVTAIDLSPNMIDAARKNSAGHENIRYLQVDYGEIEFELESFDLVASIATFHHLPFEAALAKMASLVRPGGMLLILDLSKSRGLRDRFLDCVAGPAAVTLRVLKTGRLFVPPVIREAWNAHGQHDVYMTTDEVRRRVDSILPGAAVRRHLLWRYSVVWKKPVS